MALCALELTLDFETGWEELVRLSSRWINAPDLEKATADLVSARVKEIDAVLDDKYETFLSEDYYVIHVNRAARMKRASPWMPSRWKHNMAST